MAWFPAQRCLCFANNTVHGTVYTIYWNVFQAIFAFVFILLTSDTSKDQGLFLILAKVFLLIVQAFTAVSGIMALQKGIKFNRPGGLIPFVIIRTV
eukprot:CAMPEP_0115001668 /NCGR_PEP_ID=MMETSP0216-20121206/17525_1 /TAXON_ID=223996 /ORGANISM="Protocruzia adherens, Strain Boccale" /LENGTH=95 /DNA_ID=CAMNT_0002367071 /DNA_START=141 /DNA_END=424 /DNA_ORIENTATION=-